MNKWTSRDGRRQVSGSPWSEGTRVRQAHEQPDYRRGVHIAPDYRELREWRHRDSEPRTRAPLLIAACFVAVVLALAVL